MIASPRPCTCVNDGSPSRRAVIVPRSPDGAVVYGSEGWGFESPPSPRSLWASDPSGLLTDEGGSQVLHQEQQVKRVCR
jgi:hypothetical protein